MINSDPIIQQAVRQFATLRAGDLKHPANWIRQADTDKEARIATARSYLANPINFIVVTPAWKIIDGNRRLQGILEDTGSETMVPVCITGEEISPLVSLEIMLQTAEHTKSLTDYQKFLGYSEWLDTTGSTARALSERLHLTESTLCRILTLSKCIPAVHEAAKAGRIVQSDWLAISKSDEQAMTLGLRLSGEAKNREQLERAAKATKKPKADTVRLAKVKCPLPSGVVIQLSGEEITLDECIESMGEALKMMKQAQSKSLHIKTAQRLWLDLAAN